MLIAGLTGGIASGKSTVSNLFRLHGVPVVDADILAREAFSDPKVRRDVVGLLGMSILNVDNSINRAEVGKRIFSDMDLKRQFDKIMHTKIQQGSEEAFDLHRGEKPTPPFIVYDAALLVESGKSDKFSPLVVVACTEDVQLERLMKRNGLSRKDALSRIKSQFPLERKLNVADFVIWNNGSFQDLQEKFPYYLNEVRKLVETRLVSA